MHADGKSTLTSVSKWNSGKVNWEVKLRGFLPVAHIGVLSNFLGGGRSGGWGGGSSERCLKWGGGVIKGSLQKHLKTGGG